MLAFAVVSLAGFGIAGIFTARVATSMGDHVLLTGRNCGWRNDTDFGAFITTAYSYNTQRYGSSSDYALRCYGRRNGTANTVGRKNGGGPEAAAPRRWTRRRAPRCRGANSLGVARPTRRARSRAASACAARAPICASRRPSSTAMLT
jgi:hypothetical protein